MTRDDYARNHFDRRNIDRRLCETEVEMPTGCHCVCAVASHDGDEAVETASDCHLIRNEGNPACIDAAGLMNDDMSGVARVI